MPARYQIQVKTPLLYLILIPPPDIACSDFPTSIGLNIFDSAWAQWDQSEINWRMGVAPSCYWWNNSINTWSLKYRCDVTQTNMAFISILTYAIDIHAQIFWILTKGFHVKTLHNNLKWQLKIFFFPPAMLHNYAKTHWWFWNNLLSQRSLSDPFLKQTGETFVLLLVFICSVFNILIIWLICLCCCLCEALWSGDIEKGSINEDYRYIIIKVTIESFFTMLHNRIFFFC